MERHLSSAIRYRPLPAGSRQLAWGKFNRHIRGVFSRRSQTGRTGFGKGLLNDASCYELVHLSGRRSAKTIRAGGCVAAHQGRIHDCKRRVRQCRSNFLASLVNSLLLSSVAAPGSRFSPRSEGSAATSGSKHRRCNVHNGLAWCRYVAQGPPAQPPAPSPRRATITSEATLRMDLSEGPVRRPPADRTSGMARPSARCCA